MSQPVGKLGSSPDERRRRITDAVCEAGRMTVEELAERLAVSRETIRRDLTHLDDQGLLRKFHGGAAAPDLRREGSLSARMADQRAEKRQIARAAAALFVPGSTLMIDTGSTTLLFAEELAQVGDLTVITNCPEIAGLISRGAAANRCWLLGGRFDDLGRETLGPMTVQGLARFRTEHAVIGIAAVDAVAGFMDVDPEEAELAREMAAMAEAVTVLADHSKLGRRGLFQVLPLERVHRLVTDAAPEDPLAQALADAGVRVVVA